MKILSAAQIREWDAYTIAQEKITSLDLMERAVTRCASWLEAHHYCERNFYIYCGKGNNGGDGLALARMLSEKNAGVTVFILETGAESSDDFSANLERLRQTAAGIVTIHTEEDFQPVPKDTVIIDALFGSGLNRPLEGLAAKLVECINNAHAECIAIDIPSGMFADRSSRDHPVVRATITLTFQQLKRSFLLPENERYLGNIQVLDIGLSPGYADDAETPYNLLERNFLRGIYKPRQAFAHKGSFGHALLVAGSYGKMGAAVLSANACLRSGVGLLTCYLPSCGYNIMQITVPEAMVITDDNEKFITGLTENLSKYDVIGVGPGLGTEVKTVQALFHILTHAKKPMVIDADALNILAAHPELFNQLVPFSILTPHPKEFDRLFGDPANDFERMLLAEKKSVELKVIIVLKGHRTFIATPGSKNYFNSTGNAGMATGGSGDTLTGILTGLVAQGYSPEQAALLGVYLHGMAGDLAAAAKSQEALVASDISGYLGEAFLDLRLET